MDLDLNHNGIPDYQEPWFWKLSGTVISKIVTIFAHPNTIAYRLAKKYLDAIGENPQ